MYFVYVLKSELDGNYYIGYTIDVHRRFKRHLNGEVRSTKYRRPLKLIYYEAYVNDLDAKGGEKFLKSGAGHKFLKKQMRHFLEASAITYNHVKN